MIKGHSGLLLFGLLSGAVAEAIFKPWGQYGEVEVSWKDYKEIVATSQSVEFTGTVLYCKKCKTKQVSALNATVTDRGATLGCEKWKAAQFKAEGNI